MQGELTRAEIELAGSTETLEVIRRRFDALEIRSPVDGTVADFQLRDELLHRPIARGDRLFAVVQPEGPWQLELVIEEHHSGPVLEEVKRSQHGLAVEYLLATDVSNTRRATLERVATRADESKDSKRLVVEAIASVPVEEGKHYVGAEVFAKIRCGPRSLGYVLFGDVIDFVRRYVWL